MDTNTVTPAKSGMSTTKKVLIGLSIVLGTIFVINSVVYTIENDGAGFEQYAEVEPAALDNPNKYRGVAQLAWDNIPSSARAAICVAQNYDAQENETAMLEMLEAEGHYDAGLHADVIQIMRSSC